MKFLMVILAIRYVLALLDKKKNDSNMIIYSDEENIVHPSESKTRG